MLLGVAEVSVKVAVTVLAVGSLAEKVKVAVTRAPVCVVVVVMVDKSALCARAEAMNVGSSAAKRRSSMVARLERRNNLCRGPR